MTIDGLFLWLIINPFYVLCVKLLHSYGTLCDPMGVRGASPSDHGILQGRVLDLVAVPSLRGIFPSRDRAPVSYLLHWHTDSLR